MAADFSRSPVIASCAIWTNEICDTPLVMVSRSINQAPCSISAVELKNSEATAFSADSTVPVVLKRVWSVRAVADNEKELNRLFVRFVLSIDRLISAFSGKFLPHLRISVGSLKT